MQERIKQVRKAHELTQAEFGERLGVKGNTVTGYETGLRTPSSAIITAICREFNVSETWLRTGEGQMTVPRSREEEIEDMVSKALSGTNEFKKAVIRMICTRTEKELEELEKMLWQIVEQMQQVKEPPQQMHVIKIAGRDGSFEERTLTDEEMQQMKAELDAMPDATGDI